MFGKITLESGLLAGAVLLLTGLAFLLGAFLFWRSESFGPLDPQRTLRLVIPGVVATALGCQVIFVSFFLSILGMRRK